MRHSVSSLQVTSLTLEFERSAADHLKLPIVRGTRVLVLAGDIHSDLDGIDTFVRPLAKRVPVIFVAGNHDKKRGTVS